VQKGDRKLDPWKSLRASFLRELFSNGKSQDFNISVFYMSKHMQIDSIKMQEIFESNDHPHYNTIQIKL
jgi:hypothetical protein